MQLSLGVQGLSLDRALTSLRRIQLDDTAWVEHATGFVRGHAELFARLEQQAAWSQEPRVLWEREVMTPRLVATAPSDPLLDDIRALLEARYGTTFPRVTLALYRDGRDSVAMHGDTIARTMDEALVATVSLGAPRRLRLAPVEGRRSVAFSLGEGDLFVMGGSCQRTWRHGIAKVAQAGARISVMFRPRWPA